MADYDPDLLRTSPPPTGTPSMSVRPRRAGPRRNEEDDTGSALSPAMRQILDHIAGRESGGRYNVIYGGQTFDPDKGHPRIAVPIKEGPNAGKTSSAAGRYQFIGSTWDRVAEKTGRHDMSKESQDINAAQLAKDTYRKQTGRDIEADWSVGSKNLREGIDRALGAEWEAFSKPGPRMDKLGSDGKPRFRFSDYAMKEHPEDTLHYMEPQQYLDLAPPLFGKPFENASGRALKKSFDRGDAIEAVPTLDVNVDGPTATVTDQDGRHRALLAQQEGIPAIPVAIRRTGEGDPKEIQGMSGTVMAHDFPKASEYQPRQEPQQQPKKPISLFGKIGEAIIPSAHAEEADPYAKWAPGPKQEADPYARWAPSSSGDAPAKRSVGDMALRAGLTAVHPALGAVAGAVDPATINDMAAGAARGLAPYAAGAGIGAAAGAPFAGVGAIPGAMAGAGAVLGTQMATGLAGLKTPQDATDAALNAMGFKGPQTPAGRTAEHAAGGAAGAVSGAGAAGALINSLKNPISKSVAAFIADRPNVQALSGAMGGLGSQAAAELGLGPVWQTLAGIAGAVAPAGKGALQATAKGIGALTSDIIGGVGTHTGGAPLREAFRAGAEGGQRANLFLEALRNNAPQEQIVETAKDAMDSMRRSRNALYKSGMVDIKDDATQLSFDPVKDALGDIQGAARYGGKVTNKEAAGKLQEIDDVVREWESDDPATFHTPQGFDALKRRVGEIWQSTTPHTQARLIVGRAYDAIKNTITDQAPTYSRVMKDYETASETLRELESAFSLRDKNSIDTALRKLQSVMRNNVNTNYGYRTTLANSLNDLVGGRLIPQIAGRALSAPIARGMGNLVTGGTALAGLAHPAAWAALPFESPRAMGEAAYYLGKLRGLLPPSGPPTSGGPPASAFTTPLLPTQPTNDLATMQGQAQ